ncbi:CHAT domain-containing protein [Lyophyllum atratum]|nr:CHAT domain-containing protein [Lyophyllum atratum]
MGFGTWRGSMDCLPDFPSEHATKEVPIDVFAIAYRACFAIGDHAAAWKWAQKAKARGFNHALEAHKEKDASTDRLPLVRSTTTMVANQSEGNVVDCGWLAMKGENVVFIDWITAGDTIYMLSSRPGETVLMHLLEIGLSTVEQWYTDLAKSKDDLSDAEEARETLLELAALCKPLQNLEVARPGDLLVLCPTKVLSKIPLHALEVDGDVLLARNPIVYTYALPVLMQCLDMFDQRREQAKDLKPSLFGNPTANTPGGERSVQRIGALMGANTFQRGDATKARFLAACQSSKLIHYHGHVAQRPQGHAMIFADSALDVAEVFRMNLQNFSPFISIVGCGSGSEKVRLGDEPFGLVSSLIYAGASTVLATLWPINDTLSGEPFSRYLFDQFIAKKNSGGRQLNVAKAVQNAALGLRAQKQTRAPYYWAGYILHGYWMFEP